jgi:hypothetical protein
MDPNIWGVRAPSVVNAEEYGPLASEGSTDPYVGKERN